MKNPVENCVNSTFSVTPTESMLDSLKNLVSEFTSDGECQEAIKSINLVLNEFVSSDSFETFDKAYRKNIVFDVTRTMVFLSQLSEKISTLKIINERSLS